MTLVVTHTTVTGAAADSTALVDGPAWDANHTLTGAASPSQGGTGVVNNAASTITIMGSFGTTFTITADTSLTLPTSGTVAVTSNKLSVFAATSSSELAGVISDETGSGALVFGTTPTIATPVINGIPTGTGVASAATASTLVSRDANANSFANNFSDGYTTTATAAGTTTLTVASSRNQFFTGVTTQTVTLPVTSTLTLGHQFFIENNSTGVVTVNSSGGNGTATLAGGASVTLTCILTSGTTAASWQITTNYTNIFGGKLLAVQNSLTFAGTDGTTMTFPTTSATLARTDAANTFTGVQTFSSQPILSSLTASSAVATDASKGLVSVTNTGSGNNVLATSPTLTTPLLGTPTSGTLTSCTGLPLSTGVTGTLAAAQFPALTGDATTSAGSLATTVTKINGVDQTTAWTTYTPTITAQTGTPTTTSATGRSKTIGKTVIVEIDITITNIGTAAGYISATIPFTGATSKYAGIAFEYSTTGKSGAGFINTSGTAIQMRDAAAGSFWVNGYALAVTVVYEIP